MRRSVLAVVALVVGACDPGDVRLLAPEAASDDGATRIHATLDSPYVALAATLGWGAGIPGATVRVHRAEEPYDSSYWVTAETNSSGTAVVPGLLRGLYEVEVVRRLEGSEQERAGGVVRVVAGGRLARLPKDVVEIEVEPNHERTLVFSEMAIGYPQPWEVGGGNYDDGKYLEIFNNSDQTQYLDGMLFGVAYHFNSDSAFRPCSMSEVVLNDPDGVWTKHVLRFPGRGRDYGVAPGEIVVVARSAVDHRPVHPSLVDLSGADFEWGGSQVADNPDVPNLTDVGPTQLYPQLPMPGMPVYLARPLDLQGLPSWIQPADGYRYIRIPAEAVLDAAMAVNDFTKQSYQGNERCLQALNARFERLPGPAWWGMERVGASYSLQRRVVGVRGGRKLLQDTNTSMADFVRAFVSPGVIPDLPGGG